MVDWSKYPVIRARVSPTLRDDVHAAADQAGLSVPDWTRWALHTASTSEVEPIAPLPVVDD